MASNKNNDSKDNNIKAFGKWLDVILAISGDREAPISEISEILGTTKRNAYYMLDALAEYGFKMHHFHGMYSIDPQSPFFQNIVSSISFTPEQATYLYNLLATVMQDDPLAAMLRVKLQRFYHIHDFPDSKTQLIAEKKITALKKAIYRKSLVVLHDYSSSHSQTVSDRLVEPFRFLGDESDIRAYEVSTGKNKTFKLSRIGRVELLYRKWENEDKHKDVFTDMFMFSGETRHHVKLRLGIMSHNLMMEEYPQSVKMMTSDDKKHWFFETDVANYIGIGRFILGLYDNIEVIEDDGLKSYLDEKIKKMKDA